jgi:hypothetical protein
MMGWKYAQSRLGKMRSGIPAGERGLTSRDHRGVRSDVSYADFASETYLLIIIRRHCW